MRLPASFGGGAAAGALVATLFLFALAGAFFGAGVPRIFEVLVFVLTGFVIWALASLLARGLQSLARRFSATAFVALVSVALSLVGLRPVGFRWPVSLFFPAAAVFVLAHAVLCGLVVSLYRKEGGKRLLAPVLGILVLDGLGVAFLAGEGRDPFPLPDSPEPPPPAMLDLPNPGVEGPHGFSVLTYGSGTDVRRPEFGAEADWTSKTVDASKLLPEWQGFRARMRESYWGFSLKEAPLNGRVWLPEGDGPFPVVLIVHGNHRMEEYSDPGYAYLGELLARRGFLTVSVDENYINATWSGDFRGKEMPLRAWLLLEHLSRWREWNAAAGHPMEGKADLGRVALIGHSRGGEAIAIAAAFNQLRRFPDDATIPFEFGFGIRALVAIAQTDVRYSRRIELEDVSFLALHGSYDSDEASPFGMRQFRRIAFGSDAYHFKAGVYVHGANHGQFNTVWGRTDSGPPYSWLLNLAPIISGDEQRRLARVYVSAFLEAALRGERSYLPLFLDPRVGRDWLPEVVVIPQFADSTMVPLADFEEDIDVLTATFAGARIETDGLALWREEELRFRDDQKQSTSAAVVGWKPPREALYSIRFGDERPSLEAGSQLVFSLSSSLEKPGSDTPSEKDPAIPDVLVELVDAAGRTSAIPLAEVAPLASPLRVQFLKLSRWNRLAHGRTWEPVLQSYGIAMTSFFERSSGIDPSRLAAIRFRFRGTEEGVAILDDVAVGREGGGGGELR